MSELVALKDRESGGTEYVELSTGRVFADPEGLKPLREMVPTDYVLGENRQPVRNQDGSLIHVAQLSMAAAAHYYKKVAEQTRRAVDYKVQDEFGTIRTMTAKPVERLVTMRDENGKLVAMDLAPSDVHTPSALPNYAAGYSLTEGVADLVSPVILVEKQQDVYYTWNWQNDFLRKIPNGAAPGGNVPEVNPGLGASPYAVVSYALGGFLPTEVQANADVPLRPWVKLTQMVVDGLRLEREIRVAAGLQNSANWNSTLVTTIASGAQWDEGPASNPVLNIQKAIEASYKPITGIVWSEQVEHDFLRNPSVVAKYTFKNGVQAIPDPRTLSEQLRLPPIHTAMMKYVPTASTGATGYVWGNHVVLLHQPAQIPPTDQMEVSTALTFRWRGGDAPDGALNAGMLVRTFFDPYRGPRGGTKVVVAHNDIELQTSGLVGGLILNAHQ